MSVKKKSMTGRTIIVKGARENNLKNISVELPRNKLIVFTGVSGSGKSSFVFDTLYAEGQRRYVESLSSYARQFLERIDKPDVDLISGISPAVAIEQKTGSRNTRSTVGTTTEVYDYLRLLFARIGKTHCFTCGKIVEQASTISVCDFLEGQEDGSRWYLGYPLFIHDGRTVQEELDLLKKKGFFRIYIKGKLVDLNEEFKVPRSKKDIYVVVQRLKAEKGQIREKYADTIEITFKEGELRLALISADSGAIHEFNKYYECCGIRYEEPEPRFFSFNNPFGACPVCQGFSKVYGIDMNLVVPDPNLTIVEGAIAPWRTPKFTHYNRTLIRVAREYNIPVNIPFRDLTREQVEAVKRGGKTFTGIDKFFEEMERKTYKMHIRIYLSKYRGYTTCHACKGSRLRREALQVKIADKSIYDVVQLPVRDTLSFVSALQLSEYEMKVAERILKELVKRLTFLNDVGLSYLSLDRLSSTLSGGETQRINLATALGSSLVGTLYVLDEPSIGLHPRDNEKLIGILKNLRDIGNSVVVVEHDPEMMATADIVVDMGPGAGKHGGEIVAMGTPEEIMKHPESLTGKYLRGELSIPVPSERNTKKSKTISIRGARKHNLQNIDVDFPLSKLVVVTGVSGSGKSTLVHEGLYAGLQSSLNRSTDTSGAFTSIKGFEYVDAVEIVDQSPIGQTPRSNPISYIKAFELIREIFASTHLAKSRGYKPGYFSFNIPGGRCETCQGEGFVKVEMQFLADIFLRCEDCKGSRYKTELLDIQFRGKNIVEVLEMSVDEAIPFFYGKDKLVSLLQILSDVGLGYITLGQPANTLSGGEAQRVKLALHMSARKAKNHTMFIFDEPTTGLHFHDIAKLMQCFRMLLENNNSVVIIEHNLDVIKSADYIIDLGPEAGDRGGNLVAAGTPEEIAAHPESITGRYLAAYLGKAAGNS